MQYDFTLLANGGQQLDVRGKFFKYVSGTGKIRVRINRGGYVDLLPGQGVWNVEFDTLNVSDRTGAANAGTILAGEFDFHDDRIAGDVNVIDNSQSLTMTDQNFLGSGGVGAAAGLLSIPQLFNPAGSGKNVIVKKLALSTDTAGILAMSWNAVDLNTNALQLTSKRSGLVSGVSKINRYANAAAPAGTQFFARLFSASVPQEIKLDDPIILLPGYGFFVSQTAVNTTVQMNVEVQERAV